MHLYIYYMQFDGYYSFSILWKLLYHFLSENLCDPHSEQVTLSPLQIDLQIANFQNCEYALKPNENGGPEKRQRETGGRRSNWRPKRFTMQEMARGLSLSDEALLVFEAQEPNT